MKNICLFLILGLVLFSISGCIFILGGAAGALGAYGISKDTIQGETEKPYDALWSSAVEISRIRGTIKQEDAGKGYIEFRAQDSSRVWIRLVRLSQTSTRLRISCRKYHFPNLSLAEELYVKILEAAQ